MTVLMQVQQRIQMRQDTRWSTSVDLKCDLVDSASSLPSDSWSAPTGITLASTYRQDGNVLAYEKYIGNIFSHGSTTPFELIFMRLYNDQHYRPLLLRIYMHRAEGDPLYPCWREYMVLPDVWLFRKSILGDTSAVLVDGNVGSIAHDNSGWFISMMAGILEWYGDEVKTALIQAVGLSEFPTLVPVPTKLQFDKALVSVQMDKRIHQDPEAIFYKFCALTCEETVTLAGIVHGDISGLQYINAPVSPVVKLDNQFDGAYSTIFHRATYDAYRLIGALPMTTFEVTFIPGREYESVFTNVQYSISILPYAHTIVKNLPSTLIPMLRLFARLMSISINATKYCLRKTADDILHVCIFTTVDHHETVLYEKVDLITLSLINPVLNLTPARGIKYIS